MSAIDWKVELRKIEREVDGLPPELSPAAQRAQRAAEKREKQRREERNARIGVWARLALVAILAGALFFWPYARTCGWGLLAYMASQATIVVGGLWVAVCTWHCRMARTHALAIVMLLWGLALVANQILPRVGYGATDLSKAPRWWCAETVSSAVVR
jgi:hypothetical protein